MFSRFKIINILEVSLNKPFLQGLIFVISLSHPSCLALLWGIWVEPDENCITSVRQMLQPGSLQGLQARKKPLKWQGKRSPARGVMVGVECQGIFPSISSHIPLSQILYICFLLTILSSLKRPDEFIWHFSLTCRIKPWVIFQLS